MDHNQPHKSLKVRSVQALVQTPQFGIIFNLRNMIGNRNSIKYWTVVMKISEIVIQIKYLVISPVQSCYRQIIDIEPNMFLNIFWLGRTLRPEGSRNVS